MKSKPQNTIQVTYEKYSIIAFAPVFIPPNITAVSALKYKLNCIELHELIILHHQLLRLILHMMTADFIFKVQTKYYILTKP